MSFNLKNVEQIVAFHVSALVIRIGRIILALRKCLKPIQ